MRNWIEFFYFSNCRAILERYKIFSSAYNHQEGLHLSQTIMNFSWFYTVNSLKWKNAINRKWEESLYFKRGWEKFQTILQCIWHQFTQFVNVFLSLPRFGVLKLFAAVKASTRLVDINLISPLPIISNKLRKVFQSLKLWKRQQSETFYTLHFIDFSTDHL